jgi:hypothetical protein
MPLRERRRLQLDHKPQQPAAQLLGAAGLRRLHYLIIDRG